MKYRENAQDTWHELTIKALDSMEIGSIIAFAGDTIPTGWLVCDGSTITQSAYPELYALIGGTLPDFKGKTLVGKDSNDTAFDTLLDTGGEKAVQLTTDNLASNVINTATTGSNSDGYIMRGGYTASGTYNIGGSGVAHNNLQPYGVINWIIKATNTTPTMASVVNATNNSTTDAYSCDYSNEHYGGVVLYENSNGAITNITLSESTNDYSCIEIWFGKSSDNARIQKFYDTNGNAKTLYSVGNFATSGVVLQELFKRIEFNGTTITSPYGFYRNTSVDGTFSCVQENEMKIYKIIGYK